jgi:hypothetical protein
MATTRDPDRMGPGDAEYGDGELGDDRASRFGIPTGGVVALVVLIALAFLAIVFF